MNQLARISRRNFLLLIASSMASPVIHAQELPPGVRIVSAGHSFHVWMPAMLTEIAAKAGIVGHKQVALSGIGGSRTIQHWEAEGEKQKVKPVLIAGAADVLTLAPIFLPDAGVGHFVKLGLEHNANLRITVQEFWMPFDDPSHWETRGKGVTIDRDTKTMAELTRAHMDYFKSIDDHVRELNVLHGKEAVFVVPSGQAVLALREAIIDGKVPGIAKQSELFTDPIGHPREAIKVLATYCHYAVIYGRSPVGLPTPAAFAKVPEAEKLNLLLQEIAWEAVTAHPLSGVKAEKTKS